jgi:aminotransferase
MIPLNPDLSGLKRSAIRRFTNLANETPGCIKLTIGEPDFDTPQPIKDAAAAALAAGQTHYAPNQGIPALRKAVADYETKRGMAVTPEQVLITSGATGALYTALTGILHPGDEVIVPVPAFVLYESIITAAGAKMVPLDISKTGFQIDKNALCALITPRTRAIILNSPNNPSGVVLNRESLAAVKAAVLDQDIWILCDNVYQLLTEGECPDLSLDEDLRDRLLLCQSFSKPYAMTGWRAGYLVGPEKVMERLLLLHAAMVASVPTFIQTACVAALCWDTSEMAAVYTRRRKFVARRLREMGLAFPEPEGAFYAWVKFDVKGMTSAQMSEYLLNEAKIVAVPGIAYGEENVCCLHLSFATATADLEAAADRIKAAIEKLQ